MPVSPEIDDWLPTKEHIGSATLWQMKPKSPNPISARDHQSEGNKKRGWDPCSTGRMERMSPQNDGDWMGSGVERPVVPWGEGNDCIASTTEMPRSECSQLRVRNEGPGPQLGQQDRRDEGKRR